MCLGLFSSILDGHPLRRCPPAPRSPLYKIPLVDALQRSVPPDDVVVSGTRGWRSQCILQSMSVTSFLSGF